MSFGDFSFFDSPTKPPKPELAENGAPRPEVDLRFDTDAFFGERVTNIAGLDDALTDETSPNTRGTTPARSEGWLIEDDPLEVEDEPSDKQLAPESPIDIAPPSAFGPSVIAYNFEGKTITIKRRSKPLPQRYEKKADDSSRAAILKLVHVSLHHIVESLANETSKKLEIASDDTGLKLKKRNNGVEETLWTDKYCPRHFTDLIGDERVHRETMAWIKGWDGCVFPEKALGKRKIPIKDGEQQFVYQDEYHRPREKILLLSGPPGLGKTTLAHIAARQAGYAVMEINASDARSGNTIEDRIRPALEAGSAIGETRPVLVVIDEIDGATGGTDNTAGFVQKLISLTYDKPKKKNTKRQKDARRPLLRPIICICNDLYASSLTKLRPIAKIIRFQKPAPLHLVKRLKEICESEQLKADSRSLTALAGISQGDMRGCLNTLQLLKAKHTEITESIVRKATVGMKESESSFMDTMTDVFTPLSKSRVKDLGMSSEEARYVSRISRALDSTGSMDKVAMACFEHYLNYRVHDANFTAYEKAHEWLLSYDNFTHGMWQDREHAIMPYLTYFLTPFHPLFATKGGPKLERPKMDWEAFQKQRMYEEIYKSLARNVLGDGTAARSSRKASQYRHLVANNVLQLEFAPLLNRIISPPLKPVNKQVIKPDERLLMSRVVDIMVALDLRFVQEKQDDGVMVYRLEPPIDVFVTYDEKRAADIAVSRYATRHLIAAEIDAQAIEQHAEAAEETTRPKVSSFFSRKAPVEEATSSPVKGGEENRPSSPVMKNRKRKREEQEIDIADRPPVDFFGRLITPKNAQEEDIPDQEHKVAFKVTYRYNEGMSAAVRKPVQISSLIK